MTNSRKPLGRRRARDPPRGTERRATPSSRTPEIDPYRNHPRRHGPLLGSSIRNLPSRYDSHQAPYNQSAKPLTISERTSADTWNRQTRSSCPARQALQSILSLPVCRRPQEKRVVHREARPRFRIPDQTGQPHAPTNAAGSTRLRSLRGRPATSRPGVRRLGWRCRAAPGQIHRFARPQPEAERTRRVLTSPDVLRPSRTAQGGDIRLTHAAAGKAGTGSRAARAA